MGTKISITEGTNELSGILLNIAELEKNTEYSRIAYCSKIDIGTTSDGKPFFKFNLLDKGGHAITGRLFNVEDVESKGITANNIKDKVVKIRFSKSTFMSTDSLTIYSVDPVPEDALSKEEFIGKLSGVTEAYRTVEQYSDYIIAEYKDIGALIQKYNLLSGIDHVGMEGLWAERSGGAVIFTSKLLDMASTLFEEDPQVLSIILLSEIFMYWKYSANYEENVLSLGDNINLILAKTDKYIDAVLKVAKDKNEKEEVNICKETKHLLKCYFGYDEPKTYLTKSIKALRDTMILKYQLEDQNGSMLSGTYKYVQVDNAEPFQMVKL